MTTVTMTTAYFWIFCETGFEFKDFVGCLIRSFADDLFMKTNYLFERKILQKSLIIYEKW